MYKDLPGGSGAVVGVDPGQAAGPLPSIVTKLEIFFTRVLGDGGKWETGLGEGDVEQDKVTEVSAQSDDAAFFLQGLLEVVKSHECYGVEQVWKVLRVSVVNRDDRHVQEVSDGAPGYGAFFPFRKGVTEYDIEIGRQVLPNLREQPLQGRKKHPDNVQPGIKKGDGDMRNNKSEDVYDDDPDRVTKPFAE